MKVVILGGTGFIGSRLTQTLREKGRHPVIISRSPDRSGGRFSQGVTVAGYDQLAESLEGAEAVVNLAGASIADGRWTEERKRLILKSRVESCITVGEALQSVSDKPRVWVQGSAIGYYGDTGDTTVDESAGPGSGFLSDTAVRWERTAKEQAEKCGVRLALARTGVVLGEGGGILDKFRTPFKFFVGGPLGSGEQWISWVHMDDEVGGLMHCMETEGAEGPYNLTAPEPVTMKTFCDELGKALGRPSWLRAPSFALRLGLGEMAREMILAGQRVAPTRLLQSGYSFAYPTVDKALQAILG